MPDPTRPGTGWPAVDRTLAWIGRVEDALLVLLLTGMLGLAVTQIVLRNLASTALVWGDPVLRTTVLWVGLLGAVAATRDGRQISVDVLSRVLTGRWRMALGLVTDLFTAGVTGVLAWHAVRLVIGDRAAGAQAFGTIPLWLTELVLPAAFALLCLRHAVQAIGRGRLILRPDVQP